MKQGRKLSGAKYHARRKKRLHEQDSQEHHVLLGETKRKQRRVKAGEIKTILLKSNEVNVLVAPGKMQKANIENVIETPQNTFLARQNRLLKGAIIQTSLGKARIINRPTREGCINAILVKE